MPTEYSLRLRGKQVAVEARINDLPFVILEEGGNAPSARMNHLVTPGHNEIEIYASHLPERPQLSPTAQIIAQVTKNGQEIYTHTWNATPAQTTLPPKITGAFQAGEAFGAWEWQNAPALPQTLPQAGELDALLEKMHHALTTKNADAVMALLALKNREMARAFGKEETRMEASQRAFFVELFAEPTWEMEPLNLAGAKRVFYANRRVVQTLTHDDKEPLRTKLDEEGADFSMPLLISHLKHGWIIVR